MATTARIDEPAICAPSEPSDTDCKAETQRKQDTPPEEAVARTESPLMSLPNDIWLMVLETAFRHRFPRCHNPRSTLTDSPIAFSHVSRRFRELALGLPSIWTCVHVNARQSPVYHYMLEEQLRRSQNLPLSVTFICRVPDGREPLDPSDDPLMKLHIGEPDSHFLACWRQLLPHAHRWRHLSLWAEDVAVVDKLLGRLHPPNQTKISFPQLEHLDVCVRDIQVALADDEVVTYSNLSLIQDVPKLSTLRLCGVLALPQLDLGDEGYELHSTDILANITKLSLTDVWLQAKLMSSILTAVAGSLSVLVLDGLDLGGRDLDVPAISLPHLHHLVLKVHSAVFWTIYFSSAAPNLSLFEIENKGNALSNPQLPLVCSAVFPKVKRLHLLSFKGGNGLFITFGCFFETTFLELFPAVEHIIIHGYSSTTTSIVRSGVLTILRSLKQLYAERKRPPPLKRLWVSHDVTASFDSKDPLDIIVELQSGAGCPLDEAFILMDTKKGMRGHKPGGRGQDRIDASDPDMLFSGEIKDDWLTCIESRHREWLDGLDCPALPYWEPCTAVSWSKDNQLRSTRDIV